MRKLTLTAITLFVIAQISFAQRNCGTMEYLQEMIQQDPSISTNMQQIENFTQQWIAENPGIRTVVTVPVVVHVVYNTSAQNISDALVQANISQMNLDYSRTNTDAGNTPSAFQSVAANTSVQFCLAARDPNGNATNGIEHVNTTVTSFSSNDHVKHAANGGADAWPAANYLNIWVCNLGGGLLGYSTFPGGSASVDGCVILYSSVGSMLMHGSLASYNLGRTMTHEVGHWLNLYHNFQGGCTNSTCSTQGDHVCDTPPESTSNFGCPNFPHITCSNGPNGDMFMNYMDYVDDNCMNMFSAGQTARLQAIFASGGPRFSILSSLGCVPPNGGTCSTPTGLSTSGITTTLATLNWSSVSSATSYNVQYRVNGTTTWTNTTSSTNSKAISGLTSNTTYEFQVQSVCGASTSSYSGSTTFTTSGGTSCSDNYEPNNTKGTAAQIAVNTTISGLIGTSGDNDWFSFTNSSSQKNIQITLTNLPFDYDVKLYKPDGNVAATSQNSGTTSETITWNNGTVGTYKIKVYGYNGAFSASQCYHLQAAISGTPFRTDGSNFIDATKNNSLSVYPNPNDGNMAVNYIADENKDFNFSVLDITGRVVFQQTNHAFEGDNTYYIDLKELQTGVYIGVINDGVEANYTKFVIEK